jgi:hypothetical protein
MGLDSMGVLKCDRIDVKLVSGSRSKGQDSPGSGMQKQSPQSGGKVSVFNVALIPVSQTVWALARINASSSVSKNIMLGMIKNGEQNL